MIAHRVVSRMAMRHAAPCLRMLSTSPAVRGPGLAFQAYPLTPTMPPPRGDEIPESSIAQPTPNPDTRPAKADGPSSSTFAPSNPPPTSATTTTTTQSSAPSRSAAAQPPLKTSEQDAQKTKPVRPRPKMRVRKAAMKLTPAAVAHIRALLDQPEPKLIRVGVRNRGCSGLTYQLDYVDRPASLDEEVVQDGVTVLIDSKALFSIIGSEMDWVEDKLSERFVFRNPNIKEQCGCGESFMV